MQELNFNIFNIIIISGVIHGLLFSAFVLLNKTIKNNKYLALTVLFLSLSNLQYWAIDIHLVNLYPVFQLHLYSQSLAYFAYVLSLC